MRTVYIDASIDKEKGSREIDSGYDTCPETCSTNSNKAILNIINNINNNNNNNNSSSSINIYSNSGSITAAVHP